MKGKILSALLAAALLVGCLTACGDSGAPSASKEASTSSAAAAEGASEPEASEPEASSEVEAEPSEAEPESQAAKDSGSLGDFEVAILDARLGKDYNDQPALIVKYSFTNNADENKMFMASVSDKAFQGGVQLEAAIIIGDDSYSAEDSMKEIQPGAAIELEQAYLLSDETSPVDIEVSELISLSKEKLTKTFDITALS